jgi:hypothetical protein
VFGDVIGELGVRQVGERISHGVQILGGGVLQCRVHAASFAPVSSRVVMAGANIRQVFVDSSSRSRPASLSP